MPYPFGQYSDNKLEGGGKEMVASKFKYVAGDLSIICADCASKSHNSCSLPSVNMGKEVSSRRAEEMVLLPKVSYRTGNDGTN